MPAGRPHSRTEHVGGGSGHVFSGGPSGGGFGGGFGGNGGGNRPGMSRAGGFGILGTIFAIIMAIIGGFAGFGGNTGSNVQPYYTTYSNSSAASNTDESVVDTNVDGAARSKFTSLKGNGQDKVTLML